MNQDRIEVIGFDEMKEALSRSGYVLEKQMSDLFASNNFRVVPNQIIVDPISEKRREVDFVAMSMDYDYDSKDHFGYEIICECENTTQPIVFIPSEFTKHSYISEIKASGFGTKIGYALNEKRDDYPLSDIPVSSQYCSFQKTKGNNGKWIALHPNDQHDTFDKLKKAVQHRKENFAAKSLDTDIINGRFHFGLLIVNSDIYKLNVFENGKFDLEEVNRIKYKITDYNPDNEFYENYYVEVINTTEIDNYINDIRKEGGFLKDFLKKNRKAIIKLLKEDKPDLKITWI